jgi:hypothetical protein
MKTKLRKQVSLNFLEYTKIAINDLLSSKIPQFAKQRLCFVIEKMLMDTKSYNGFKYLYWSKYGCLDWEEAKKRAVYKEVPKEFMYGPDDTGELDFISDIQGQYSRRYI